MASRGEPVVEDAAAAVEEDGISPGTIVIVVVVGLVLLIGVVNYILWWYANKNAVPRPKKKVGVKKAKRERLKQGIRPPGDD